MTTIYVPAPPPGPSADNTDAVEYKLAQPTSPSAAQWLSVPQLFTPFGQQTVGTARSAG